MGEPFKDLVNRNSVTKLGKSLQKASNGNFKNAAFVRKATKSLEDLELLARVKHVSDTLAAGLSEHFDKNVNTISDALPAGLSESDQVTELTYLWPLTQYVQDYGLTHPKLALELIYEITQRMTCEFAIRPYVVAHQALTLKYVKRWMKDPNEHVRRLCSEGVRPRLPWGQQLKGFVRDPSPIMFVLEHLKDDEALYVRKSVANCLNDISKDHPKLVVATAKAWKKGADKNREWVIKHALRTLIKKGDPKALALVGITKPKLKSVAFSLSKKRVKIGDSFEMTLKVENQLSKAQPLLVDYIIHFQTARGVLSPKVLKWKRISLAPGSHETISKVHKMKVVTTRKFYPGKHEVEVQINGSIFAKQGFTLTK